MNLKERIKTLCKEKGITVNKLEKTLGFGTGYVAKLDNSTPNAAKIKMIADFFGVTVDYLMTGKKPEIPQIEFTAEDGLLIEMYSKINKEQKTAVLNLIRSMLSEN